MFRKLLERPIQTACVSSVLLHAVLFLLFVFWMASSRGSGSSIVPVPEVQAVVVDPDMFHIEVLPEAPPEPEPPLPVPEAAQAKPPAPMPAVLPDTPRKTLVMVDPRGGASLPEPVPPATPSLQPTALDENRVNISDRNLILGANVEPVKNTTAPSQSAREEATVSEVPPEDNANPLVREEVDVRSTREPLPVATPIPPRSLTPPANDYVTPVSVPGDVSDAVGSPLYAYHQQVRRAIFVSWLNKSAGAKPGAGALKVIFFLTDTGTPADIQVIKDNAGPVSRRLLLQSILTAAIPPIPKSVLVSHASEFDRGRLPYTFDIQIKPSQ